VAASPAGTMSGASQGLGPLQLDAFWKPTPLPAIPASPARARLAQLLGLYSSYRSRPPLSTSAAGLRLPPAPRPAPADPPSVSRVRAEAERARAEYHAAREADRPILARFFDLSSSAGTPAVARISTAPLADFERLEYQARLVHLERYATGLSGLLNIQAQALWTADARLGALESAPSLPAQRTAGVAPRPPAARPANIFSPGSRSPAIPARPSRLLWSLDTASLSADDLRYRLGTCAPPVPVRGDAQPHASQLLFSSPATRGLPPWVNADPRVVVVTLGQATRPSALGPPPPPGSHSALSPRTVLFREGSGLLGLASPSSASGFSGPRSRPPPPPSSSWRPY
jgi:hypothetical protein